MDGEWTCMAAGGGHQGGPDPEFGRLTRGMLEEERRQAEEARRREAAPPPPPAPSPRQSADMLKNAAAFYASSAMGASGLGAGHDLAAHEVLLSDFLAEAGEPADPVERMLLEQMHLAQHAIGRLHVRAGLSADPQVIVAFLGAAARLTAELRRLALSVEAYRTSVAARAVKAAEVEKAGRKGKKPAARCKPVGAADGRARNGVPHSPDTGLGSNGPGCNRLVGYFDELQPALS